MIKKFAKKYLRRLIVSLLIMFTFLPTTILRLICLLFDWLGYALDLYMDWFGEFAEKSK